MVESVDGDGPMTPDEVTLAPAPDPAGGRRRRTLALWSVIVVLVVGAGALVVQTRDDDPPRLPIALGSAPARGESAAMSADMSMAAWITYIAGDDLPLLGDPGPAHRLGGEVTERQVRGLAEHFGLDGDPVEQDGGWHVAGDAGVLDVYPGAGGQWWFSNIDPASFQGGGTAGSSGSASCGADADVCEDVKAREEAAARGADITTTTIAGPVFACEPDVPDCVLPEPDPITPPADLPDEDGARQAALDLFEDLGIDVTDAEVAVEGPYEAWYVTVEPRIDGRIVSGLSYNASVGSKGAITSAGGTLNAPERLGEYPVLDTHEAIDRLNAQVGAYGGRREVAVDDLAVASEAPTTTLRSPDCTAEPQPDGSVSETCSAVSCAVTDTPAIASEAGDDPVPTTEVLDDPDTPVASDPGVPGAPPSDVICPTEPYIPPEPVEVVLHEAEEILVLVGAFDDSGEAYLVPGYRMRGDDDQVVDVASVDDESLLPPPDPEPAPVPPDEPVTTVPGETRCAQPEPGPDGAVPEICLDPNSLPPAEPQVDVAPPVGEGSP